MLFPKNLEEVKALIENKIPESLHLDFKSSPALSKEKKDEIIKDVTAFANSDGGVLVYGIKEENNIPFEIDEGVDNTKITREWLEQIFNTNITPTLNEYSVLQIPIDEKHSIYSIKVSKSFRGPHQSSDKKYYKRYNYISVPMDHYEIEDVRNRQVLIPSLINAYLDIKNYTIKLVIENIGPKPATNVKLKFSDEFSWPMNNNVPHAFENGIKHLSPRMKLSFFVGSLSLLKGDNIISLKEYLLVIEYDHPESLTRIKDEFVIDFKDLSGILLDRDENENIIKAIREGFKDIAKEISYINKELKSINSKVKR